MKNKKKLKCVESYEEDLTGNDDYIELWTAGEIYDSIKNEDGSYTVRTNIATDGMVGENYMCTPDYFEEMNTN